MFTKKSCVNPYSLRAQFWEVMERLEVETCCALVGVLSLGLFGLNLCFGLTIRVQTHCCTFQHYSVLPMCMR